MSKKKNVERPLPRSLGLPLVGVDSHAHLDLDLAEDGLAAVLHRACESGVSAVGQVFLSPDAYEKALPTFSACVGPGFPELFFLLAIHPCEAMRLTSTVLEAMRRAFKSDSRLRAVGETGLDFYWEDCPHLIQEEAFRLHIALAREVGRPVAVHSRDAAKDTLRVLEAEGLAGHPVLWHCFSGDAVAHVERILANGWHISVPGPVSYKANDELRAALRLIPEDRLLLETDCPYLAPEPWRGKRNEPALAVFTAQAMAEALHEDPAALWARCGRNARAFFGLN